MLFFLNIVDYVKQYRSYSFDAKEFNNVDALVLSYISYLSFEKVLPTLEDNKPSFLIGHLMNKEIQNKLYLDAVDHDRILELFNLLNGSIRYGGIKFNDARSFVNHELDNSYFSMSIFLPDGTAFISFRGTDQWLVGWKEDFNLCHLNEIPSQLEALDYLNEFYIKYPNVKLRMGGHSKGGNIAYYAALKANEDIFNNIIKVYSFDGPGFIDDSIYKIESFEKRKTKLYKLIGQGSLVGVLLNNQIYPHICKCEGNSFAQHDAFNWNVDIINGDFELEIRRNVSSINNEKAINRWLKKLNKEDKKFIVEYVYYLVDGKHKTINDLPPNKRKLVSQLIHRYLKSDKQNRKRFKALIKALVKEKRLAKKETSK